MTDARHGTTDDGTGTAHGRRGLRRLFARAADPDRSSRRAGGDPVLAPARVSPRVWVALA